MQHVWLSFFLALSADGAASLTVAAKPTASIVDAATVVPSTVDATRAAQSKTQFRARLSTVPIDLAMQNNIAGKGSVAATLVGNTLTVSGEFSGLKTPATIAKLHAGPKGIRGPAILDLTISQATSGTISGTFELTPEQVADLKNSRLYIQVHSAKAPEGNLWGWLLPQEVRR